MAEVGLDHVGIVLGIEISRLARSSRDWYQLLEVCGLLATLIGDADGVYDPQTYNDRLLLGLKGTMSEAELHILKQRMLEGKRAKARRGELHTLLPRGYVRAPSGEVLKDPDEQVRGVIETVFRQFQRCGTINGVLRYLVDHHIQLPDRVRSGPRTGELDWRRPNRVTLSNLLHNPIYAGAYVYGRRPTDPRRRQPGRPSSGRTVAPQQQWEVLIKDHLPAYIGWDHYERNLRQLAANTAQAGGVVRAGPSLLSGRLICGRCGLAMATQYTNSGSGLRYVCSREAVDYGAPLCQSLSGAPLDALIGWSWRRYNRRPWRSACRSPRTSKPSARVDTPTGNSVWSAPVMTPSVPRGSIARSSRRIGWWRVPWNRIGRQPWPRRINSRPSMRVAWRASRPPCRAEERARIRQLASDLPALWNAETTGNDERQAIVRLLVERVIVTVIDDSEQVTVEVHWIGGHHTRERLTRPVARLEQLSTYPELAAHVLCLHQEGRPARRSRGNSMPSGGSRRNGGRPSTLRWSPRCSPVRASPRVHRRAVKRLGSIGRPTNGACASWRWSWRYRRSPCSAGCAKACCRPAGSSGAATANG